MAVHACTIIARNYLPFARVLARSFHDHHPGGRVTALVLDDLERELDPRLEPFEIMHLDDLFDTQERHDLAMIYDVMELATAVKPFLLKHLLANGEIDGGREVLYLDPDIEVFSPLDFALALAREHGIVLTPHITSPLPRDGKWPSEAAILASGVFNLGFVAVGPSSGGFLDYWSERLRRDCVVDIENMLFVDQRWVDFAPGCFGPIVLRDPTVNVAYWNLDHRELSWNGDFYEVDREPLKFFHFSGYSPDAPYLLSRHQAHLPRVLLSERPALARLCAHYGARLKEEGFGDPSLGSYGYGALPSGIPIDRAMRRLYRKRLLEAESGAAQAPADPFAPSGAEDFIAWLNEPHPSFPPSSGLTRYLIAMREQAPHLQAAFGDLYSTAGADFVAWVRATMGAPGGVHPRLVPEVISVRPAAVAASSSTPAAVSRGSERSAPGDGGPEGRGVNIAGYFRAEHGVGESARLLVAAVEAGGIPYSIINEDAGLVRQGHEFAAPGASTRRFGTNILCINADMTQSFALRMGQELFDGRYTIGLWAWELEDLPPSMHPAFHYVDEVWAVSEFTRRAIAKISPRPVFAFPHAVIPPVAADGFDLAELGIPNDRFVFLFSFDLLSVFERKNPLGLIDAFETAFEPEEGPLLVLKVMGGEHRAVDLERLKMRVASRPDVVIIDRSLPQAQNAALTKRSNCYVSLHRSEGFGLSMSEAMALGKPVIATAYSGNLDFMDEENSFLVPFTPTEVPKGCEPYPSGARWADPMTGEAARLMRLVYENPDLAAAKGRRARESILADHGVEVRARFIKERLAEIWSAREGSPAVLASPAAPAGGPRSAAAAADLALGAPDVGSPARFAGPARLARRAVLRALRHHDAHQRSVDTTLAEAVMANEKRVHQTEESTAEVQVQLERVRARMGEMERSLGVLSAKVAVASERVGRAVARSAAGPVAALSSPDGGRAAPQAPDGYSRSSFTWPEEIAVGWPRGQVLVISAFGEDGVGGLFACTGEHLERLDRLPTAGLHLAGGIASSAGNDSAGNDVARNPARLLRLLHAADGPNGTAELLVYDTDGLRSHLRLDEVHDPHDVAVQGDDYVVVSTFGNEVLWIAGDGRVIRRWRAPGEPDSWHLNSLAFGDQGDLLISAFGQHSRHREWTETAGSRRGILFSLASNEAVLGSLESPHTPRLVSDPGSQGAKSWLVCSSARGQVVSVDRESRRVTRTYDLDGWTRGLVVAGNRLFVGVSAHRQVRGSGAVSRVVALDRLTGGLVGAIPLPAREIYDLVFVPEEVVDGIRSASRSRTEVLWTRSKATGRRPGAVVARYGYPEAAAEELLWREGPRDLGVLQARDCKISVVLERASERLLDRMAPSAFETLEVKIANVGTAMLSPFGDHPVRLSYRWEPVLAAGAKESAGGGTAGADEIIGTGGTAGADENQPLDMVAVDLEGARSLRTTFRRELLPGDKVRLRMLVRAPAEPGRYRIIITAVQEGVRWFDAVSRSNAWSAIVKVTSDAALSRAGSSNDRGIPDASAYIAGEVGEDGNGRGRRVPSVGSVENPDLEEARS